MDIDESTGLPSLNKFEIDTADGGKAVLLYTGSGIWEYGEENVQKAFEASVDEAKTFVLISEQDIALDVLIDFAKKNGFDLTGDTDIDIQKNYLHQMFSEHLGDKFKGMSEEDQLEFWEKRLTARSEASNHAAVRSDGLVVINVNELEASTAFGFDRDTPLSRLFLLGHEFDHADNAGKYGHDSMGTLKGETESDLAGYKAAQASGLNTEGMMEQILFYRSREAIIAVMSEEIGRGRSGWQKLWGTSRLDEFNHVTSATLTPEGEVVPDLSKKQLATSLKDFREKIIEQISPATQESALNDVVEKLNVNNAGAAIEIMEDLKAFISDHNVEDHYQGFIDNFFRHLDEIRENHSAMSEEEITQKMENAGAEMIAMFASMKENDPDLFEKMLEKGRAAEVIFIQGFNSDGQSKEFNTALHEVLSEMKENGAFKDDPIQQRIVNAFLKGPEVKPEEFVGDVNAPSNNQQEPSETMIVPSTKT